MLLVGQCANEERKRRGEEGRRGQERRGQERRRGERRRRGEGEEWREREINSLYDRIKSDLPKRPLAALMNFTE